VYEQLTTFRVSARVVEHRGGESAATPPGRRVYVLHVDTSRAL
jgi:hypothetical protein